MAQQNENIKNRLQELGGSDFEIADGQPNIKGWDVKDENGKRIGEVEELLFDTQSRKVRYIIVDLEGNVLDLEARDVLVPIGIAQLHDKDDDVILQGVTADQIRSLPDYDKDDIGTDVESKIRNVFAGLGTAGLAGAALTSGDTESDFYNHGHFNEDNFYNNRNPNTDETSTIPVIKEELEIGKRQVENGGIRLHSRIVEKDVSEDINLRQEKVNVERTTVDRPATSADMREEEIELIERKEVPVISKEARVVEEISLNKEVSEREETIRDTVRNTEVDIEETGKKDSNIDRSSF